ncbi:MAG: hypothetical protein JST54_13825 [Deltaproteobacteria bacterium]|nr:hypothetical protein [Deltaproteobacteria bacterium]
MSPVRALNVIAALGFAACATTPSTGSGDAVPPNGTPIRVIERPAPDLASTTDFDAKAEAHRFDHAADCEIEARRLKSRNPDRGWQLLRACIDRGDFTELRALLDGPWDAELRSRTDAGELLTRLVAARGGDVDCDLGLLHQHQVPIFSLADAQEQPEVYAGRYVMMRARVSDLRKRDGAVTVELDEYSHSSDVVYAAVGPGTLHTTTTNHGYREWPASGTDRTVTKQRDHVTERRTTTDDVETGRQALGRMNAADPFFEPNKDFVVLARFDSLRDRADDDGGPLAVVTVLHYFRPAALPLY